MPFSKPIQGVESIYINGKKIIYTFPRFTFLKFVPSALLITLTHLLFLWDWTQVITSRARERKAGRRQVDIFAHVGLGERGD
jgi:hypothetical protein